MILKVHNKQLLSVLSFIFFITACASSPNLNSKKISSTDGYWYCAPGDQRTWRCAENKESLGLSYYRFWKTTLDPEAEGTETGDYAAQENETKDEEVEAEQSITEQAPVKTNQLTPEDNDLLVVQAAQVSSGSDLINETAEPALPEETSVITDPVAAPNFDLNAKPDSNKPDYGKVLQLAAYHSQSQAQSLVATLADAIQKTPSVTQTRVKGQLYYTVVYERLSSQQDAEQLIAELAVAFPEIKPWLRNR